MSGRTSAGSALGAARVAVVVPLSSRPTLLPDEEISLRHLRHYLARYDRFMLAPREMPVAATDFEVLRFDERYFGNANAQARLMMTPAYYETFSAYDYILLYQLDALVLSDELTDWCATGLDFVSAPNYGLSDQLSFVCSGGFSLRKVDSFLRVLRSDRYAVDPAEYWRTLTAGAPAARRLLNLPRRYLKRLRRFNGVQRELEWFMRDPLLLDDEWFVMNAQRFYPEFRIASVQQALRFAFDENPRAAYEMNNQQLPFGAHAWYKQDREFWAPHLLT